MTSDYYGYRKFEDALDKELWQRRYSWIILIVLLPYVVSVLVDWILHRSLEFYLPIFVFHLLSSSFVLFSLHLSKLGLSIMYIVCPWVLLPCIFISGNLFGIWSSSIALTCLKHLSVLFSIWLCTEKYCRIIQ